MAVSRYFKCKKREQLLLPKGGLFFSFQAAATAGAHRMTGFEPDMMCRLLTTYFVQNRTSLRTRYNVEVELRFYIPYQNSTNSEPPPIQTTCRIDV